MKALKTIIPIGILLFSCLFAVAEKKQKADTAALNKIVQLMKSRIFYVEVDEAYPSGNSSVTINSKYGQKRIGCLLYTSGKTTIELILKLVQVIYIITKLIGIRRNLTKLTHQMCIRDRGRGSLRKTSWVLGYILAMDREYNLVSHRINLRCRVYRLYRSGHLGKMCIRDRPLAADLE